LNIFTDGQFAIMPGLVPGIHALLHSS